MSPMSSADAALLERWRAALPSALAAWSRFARLSEPRWCLTTAAEKREGLEGSFAMIRLVDHAIVVSLRQVRERGLEDFAREVLAHEVGHHVFVPGDLVDQARLLARIRAGLPGHEVQAPMVANLYADLLLNDRLQRVAGLDMAGVYRRLKAPGPADRLWTLYMRIYERLWALRKGDLVDGPDDPELEADAWLGSRVVRTYAREWLRGAGRFAVLLLTYLPEPSKDGLAFGPWLDATQAGAGDELPDGLTDLDPDEAAGAIHPADDDRVTGRPRPAEVGAGEGVETGAGGEKSIRGPAAYRELATSLGVRLPEDVVFSRYYRELAIPHLIRYPVREIADAGDPVPEGLDTWDPGSPVSAVDWRASLERSPVPIPGVTLVERLEGLDRGGTPRREVEDLFVGIDCSGSMPNPRVVISHPVIAGAILVLSALRAGAHVQVTLSGEPGKHASTDGFVRDERKALAVLTSYLGTGYSFGVLRLKDAFLDGKAPRARPAHVLLISDSDWFQMLKQTPNGWEIARDAVAAAGGGATAVLDRCPRTHYAASLDRLVSIGFDVHHLDGPASLVPFARAFSKRRYEAPVRKARR